MPPFGYSGSLCRRAPDGKGSPTRTGCRGLIRIYKFPAALSRAPAKPVSTKTCASVNARENMDSEGVVAEVITERARTNMRPFRLRRRHRHISQPAAIAARGRDRQSLAVVGRAYADSSNQHSSSSRAT